MTNVGSISLDLVIASKLNEQLEGIRVNVEKLVQRFSDGISDKLSEGFENFRPDMSSIKQSFEEINEIAKKAFERTQVKSDTDVFKNIIPEKIETKAYMKYDTEQIKAEIAEIENKLVEPVEELNRKIHEELGTYDVPTEPVERLREQINNTYFKLDLLQKKWQELSFSDPTDKVCSQLQSVQSQIISTTKQLDRLEGQLENLRNQPESQPMIPEPQAVQGLSERIRERIGRYKVPDKASEKLQNEIVNTQLKIEMLQRKWQELRDAVDRDDSDQATSKLAAVQDQIISATQKLENLKKQKEEIDRSKFGENLWKGLKQTCSWAWKAAKFIGKVAVVIGKVTGKFASIPFGIVKKGLSTIGKSLSKLTSPVKKFGSNFKRAFKSVFLMAGVYAAFKAIRNGFLETAKADEKFKKSLNDVKGNLAIAFTPIMQSVMPMLNTLMAGLASATKATAGFISGLYGKTYQQSAQAAKKLKETANAAKKAKLSMAGIDEMNILGDSSEDEEGIDFSKMDLSEPELPDWVERLKVSIRSDDWTGVGNILAERINSALSSINWDSAREKINGGIQKITDLINGFVDNLDWKLLGDSFGEGINTVFFAG